MVGDELHCTGAGFLAISFAREVVGEHGLYPRFVFGFMVWDMGAGLVWGEREERYSAVQYAS